MPSSFGKRKPVVRQRTQPQSAPWLGIIKPLGVEPSEAQETLDALYRITQSTPSRLSRARLIRAQYQTAA